MQKLNSIEQITELANELGRKVSKNDLNERFDVKWYADKQGRFQTLKIGEDYFRTDNAAFYPNGQKPKPNGKKATAPRKGKSANDIIKAFVSLCEENKIKLGLAKNVIAQLEKAEQQKAEAAIIAADAAKAEKANKIKAKIASYEAMLKALE